MKGLSFIFLIFFSTCLFAQEQTQPTWQQEPDSFRNVPWHTSEKDASKLADLKFSCNGKKDQERTCYPKIGAFSLSGPTIGEVPVNMVFTFLPDQGFVYVLLNYPSEGYERLRDAFIEKYGAPTSSEQSNIQNRMGASFQQEDVGWTGKNVSAGLSHYGINTERGIGFVGLNSYIQLMKEQRKDKTKKAADDF